MWTSFALRPHWRRHWAVGDQRRRRGQNWSGRSAAEGSGQAAAHDRPLGLHQRDWRALRQRLAHRLGRGPLVGVLHPWIAMPWRFKAEGSGRSGNRPVVARCATSDAACGVVVGVEVQRTDAMSRQARAADVEVDIELGDRGRGRGLMR